jgi:tetratricopeptide (TPR) repeat protein
MWSRKIYAAWTCAQASFCFSDEYPQLGLSSGDHTPMKPSNDYVRSNQRSRVGCSNLREYTRSLLSYCICLRRATARALEVAVVFVLAGPASGCVSRPPLPPQALRMNLLATESLRAGDLETAEIRLKLALDYNPRFVEAWVNLGLVELRRGNLDNAERAFTRSRDLNRDLPAPHHSLGLVAEARGQLREAEGYYLAALRVDPAFLPALANRGRLLFALGDLDEARSVFLTLLEVDPASDIGWAGLVETYVRLGRLRDAEVALTTALARSPNAPLIALCGARAALRTHHYDAAKAAASAMLRAADAVIVVEAHRVLALACLARGERAEAHEHAQELLGQRPDDPTAKYVLRETLPLHAHP